MTALTFRTGSAVVAVGPATPRFRQAVLAAAGSPPVLGGPDQPDVVVAEGSPEAPSGTYAPVTRGVTRHEDGAVVFASAGGSGFRQRWTVGDDSLRVESVWAPTTREAVAARALPSRFRALRGQVLLHHPVLWWATLQGLAPVHVSVVELGGTVVALAGPGGVGKTSLVARELARGARVTCDNLGVTDGTVVHGLREPLRVPHDVGPAATVHQEHAGSHLSSGPRAAHGRREAHGLLTVPALRPDLVVVVRRDGERTRLRPVSADAAHRALVAGTLAAGELMRFWPTAAMLALATGRGPVLPAVQMTARCLVDALPCHELQLGPRSASHSDPGLRELLSPLLGPLEDPTEDDPEVDGPDLDEDLDRELDDELGAQGLDVSDVEVSR